MEPKQFSKSYFTDQIWLANKSKLKRSVNWQDLQYSRNLESSGIERSCLNVHGEDRVGFLPAETYVCLDSVRNLVSPRRNYEEIMFYSCNISYSHQKYRDYSFLGSQKLCKTKNLCRKLLVNIAFIVKITKLLSYLPPSSSVLPHWIYQVAPSWGHQENQHCHHVQGMSAALDLVMMICGVAV